MCEPPGHDSLEERFEVAEERHRARRKRTARIYRTVERVFFAALVVLAFLVVKSLGVVDQRKALAHQAVEQGALPHVRQPYDPAREAQAKARHALDIHVVLRALCSAPAVSAAAARPDGCASGRAPFPCGVYSGTSARSAAVESASSECWETYHAHTRDGGIGSNCKTPLKSE